MEVERWSHTGLRMRRGELLGDEEPWRWMQEHTNMVCESVIDRLGEFGEGYVLDWRAGWMKEHIAGTGHDDQACCLGRLGTQGRREEPPPPLPSFCAGLGNCFFC